MGQGEGRMFSSQTNEDLGGPRTKMCGSRSTMFPCASPTHYKHQDTHSLLRLSSPVKAPLVSSIVPEISLWSRSLGSRQTDSSPSTLS